MALKPDRDVRKQSIAYYMNEVAERGRIVVYDTATSGLGGMDEANALVKMPTGGIGVPAGILMNDVVDLDLSRYHLNHHQDEVQKNSKVCLMKIGMVRTNCLVANLLPVAGSGAYFTTSGELTMTQPGNGTHSLVGRFDSSRDADGYARVEINLP
jgi:hypothetical protein